jgi:hypothetical protein
MRNIFSIIFTFIITAHFGMLHTVAARPSKQAKQATHPIQQDKRLKTLHELFTILGVKVDPTYEAMNAYAQAHWLRKPG